MPTRERAQAEIAARRVLVGGALAEKPARLVSAAEPVELLGPPPRFVSRGGEKLDAALERFSVPVAGRRALDAGASTGGFTDCLLQRGAAHVVAVDVGHGQLAPRLRDDPRVTVLERTNVRQLHLVEPVSLAVADLSFISLRTVAAVLVRAIAPEGDLVLLVKPQFEAGPAEASRGRGVIRDPTVWRRAVEGVRAAFAAEGATMMELMVSPLLGTEGNVEFLAHVRRDEGRGEILAFDIDIDIDIDIDALLAEGERLQARNGA
ncbi:MAG: TlyA family RNA methyltransferase [Actinomycetota bacterium]|nr:TlyA family RNA methyltransferase [Actinomycetota bacterium]